MRITCISDTHTKQRYIEPASLPGGDLLIHAGDLMNSGRDPVDIEDFMSWFDSQAQYDTKVFIAGNHDRLFEDFPERTMEIINSYKWIDYLQDEELKLYFDGPNGDEPENNVKIYGSPWQPWFHNWAFNLPRKGVELMSKWEQIPQNTDILITHGPPMGYGDTSGAPYWEPNLGCELLRARVDVIKPKIHVFGHIHGGYGYYFNGHTHFINAAILDERYNYTNQPITFDWNPVTNELNFVENENIK